jgi:hypothetical protein
VFQLVKQGLGLLLMGRRGRYRKFCRYLLEILPSRLTVAINERYASTAMGGSDGRTQSGWTGSNNGDIRLGGTHWDASGLATTSIPSTTAVIQARFKYPSTRTVQP